MNFKLLKISPKLKIMILYIEIYITRFIIGDMNYMKISKQDKIKNYNFYKKLMSSSK